VTHPFTSAVYHRQPESGASAVGSPKKSAAATPFFVVGYPRSGTTLLSVLLDRHSQVAVCPETNFFIGMCQVDRASNATDPANLVKRFVNGFRTRDLNLDETELLGELSQSSPTGGNLLLSALRVYGRKHGKQCVGEKTPDHWRFVPQLLDLYPQARVIWIARDGRDTILSLSKAPWRPHWDLEYHAWHWRVAIDCMLEFEALGAERVLRVKFEDLVSRPETELARICGFIGVDFEPRQLDTTVRSDVVPEWERPWKYRALMSPDPQRIGAAARELSSDQLQLFTKVMQPNLLRLGYRVD
jgi:hypothetical protein